MSLKAKEEKLKEQEISVSGEEVIREKAYEKWEKAGCPEGDGLEFWVEAEQEVNGTAAKK